MLRKLLKYEFQATGRIFLPLYGALFIIAIVQRVFLGLSLSGMSSSVAIDILMSIVPMLFGATIMGICVAAFIMMIQRFYKNLLGREGYLMFTLPVSVSKLIWSKLIVIAIWIILSVIAGIIAFFIVFLDTEALGYTFRQLIEGFRGLGPFSILIVDAIVFTLAALVGNILSIYMSMAIGQLSNKHKGLCSIGAYIGLSIIINNIVMAIMFEVSNSSIGTALYNAIFLNLNEIQAAHTLMLFLILFMVVQAVIYFFVTRYILSKRLNLE
ncbi:hypothetical protein IMSAG049_01494 [Clostridiales bacterium]|nr:hypothetical protein IMSAG049_01494 [Clostridiales bacterium]